MKHVNNRKMFIEREFTLLVKCLELKQQKTLIYSPYSMTCSTLFYLKVLNCNFLSSFQSLYLKHKNRKYIGKINTFCTKEYVKRWIALHFVAAFELLFFIIITKFILFLKQNRMPISLYYLPS